MADLSILLIVRRPSLTTNGIASKLESNKINSDTFLAASLPLVIATPQSETFNAKTSLTPSPTKPTVRLLACNI